MSGFDPSQDVVLDADGLRALAHPLRTRMLTRLRHHGPATPSMLARDLGESSGATSYHLRQLLVHGFVVEETERGTRRERWYRAAHRSTHFDMKLDDETRALGAEYLRLVGRTYAGRIANYTNTLDEPDDSPWADVWNISDVKLDLTVEDAAELGRELGEVLERWRGRSVTEPSEARTTRSLVAQFQLLPLPDEP